jgi:hypothetical protein
LELGGTRGVSFYEFLRVPQIFILGAVP